MIRKNLVHTFKSDSKNILGLKVGNSHVHELVASYFGFASQAAMDAEAVLLIGDEPYSEFDISDESDEQGISNQPKDSILFNERCSKFGFSSAEAKLLESLLHKLVLDKDIQLVEYKHLSEWEIGWFDSATSNQCISFKVIEALAEKGNPDALYALAIHYQTEMPEAKDGHWYREQLKGIALSETQSEFAESYKIECEQFKRYTKLLEQAAGLNHAEAALELALMDNEESETWYRKAANLGNAKAQGVLALEFNEVEWLTQAASGGDQVCLDKLARDAAEGKLENSAYEAHKWNALAKLYGFNLTESIADNEEDYGPVFVIHEGINLPALPEEVAQQAAKEAQTIFAQFYKSKKRGRATQ